MVKNVKALIFAGFGVLALASSAAADVRNVCNGGSCRTIVTDKSNKIIWVSDLWQQ